MSRRLFRLFCGRREKEREVREEIDAHLQMRIDDLVARGWAPDEAAAEARRRFGDLDAARVDLVRGGRRRDRRLRRAAALDRLRGDVVLAARRARRSPGFTALALLTLALGIGLTTAVFTAVDHVLVRPLPFADPDRVVNLRSMPEGGGSFDRVSSENWLDWVDGTAVLAASAIHRDAEPAVRLDGRTVRADAQRVTEGFFDVLRPLFAAGRAFAPSEVSAGAPLVVASEGFWRASMGAPALPADLTIGETVHQVIGVVADAHAYPHGTELWIPERVAPLGYEGARNLINWRAIGRLAPGVEMEAARVELSARAGAVQEGLTESLYSFGVDLWPLKETVVADRDRPMLLFLAAVGGILLLACLNLAGLSLARTMERSAEIGVRIALGAGRRRVVGQLLTEHMVLAVAGGALGVAVAAGALSLVERGALGAGLPRAAEISLDLRALAFALGLTALSGLWAGVLPALRGARQSRLGMRGGSRSRHGLGGLLVAAEVALAVVLLVGSGLLVRSFQSLVSRDLGFEPAGVVTAEIRLDRSQYDFWDSPAGPRARIAFWRSVLDEVARSPDVERVAAASAIPTGGGGRGFLEVEGIGQAEGGAEYRSVTGDYFDVLGIPVLQGRVFGPADGPDTERVVVVNRTFAERFWPGGGALGRRVRATSMEDFGQGAPWLTIVGVVGDILHDGFGADAGPEMFTLAEQIPYWMGSMTLVAVGPGRRTAGVPATTRAAVRAADPALPVAIALLEDRVDEWVADRLFITSVLGGFGALALVLAAIGLYGLLAFTVAGRTREIGIRAALGADRSSLVTLVVRQSLAVTLAGVGIGVLAALALGGALETLLVEVGPTDPVTLGTAPVLLLIVAVAAAWVPAWRAARIDPLEALRSE